MAYKTRNGVGAGSLEKIGAYKGGATPSKIGTHKAGSTISKTPLKKAVTGAVTGGASNIKRASGKKVAKRRVGVGTNSSAISTSNTNRASRKLY